MIPKQNSHNEWYRGIRNQISNNVVIDFISLHSFRGESIGKSQISYRIECPK